MKQVPASQDYRLPEPGPAVLAATSRNGKPNIMTMGFPMMIRQAPP
nr:hypothetical protein [Labrys sp. KNU-23]